MNDYERHEFSGVYPDWVLDDLVSDMREHGWDGPPILLYEGKVLDGWHRLCAANMVDVEPVFEEFTGTRIDAGWKVYRANLYREMTQSQRVACRIELMKRAGAGAMAAPGQQRTPHTERDLGGQFAPSQPIPDTMSSIGESDSEPSEQASFFTAGEMAAVAGSESTRMVRDIETAEKGGLGEQVRSGELSSRTAAAQARGNERDPEIPKPPSRLQQLEMKLEAKALECQTEHLPVIDSLQRELREAKAQVSEYPHEREAVANEREVIISAQTSSIAELQTKLNDERRRASHGCSRNVGTSKRQLQAG